MKIIAILLLLLIFLSGCVSVPTQITKKGEDVSVSLNLDSTEVPAGSPVGLSISIKNNALTPLTNLDVNVISPEGFTLQSSTQPPKIIEREGEWEGVWLYTTPTSVKVDTPYKFYSKITFSMNTSRGVSVTLVSYDYYKRTGEKSKISTQTPDTGGPIGIEFSPLSQMSYMYSGQGASIPLKVTITNRGSGKSYVGEEPTSTNLNKVKFYVEGKYINCSVGPNNIVYLMREGSVATVMCTINIPSTEVTDIKSFSVSVIVSYNYIYDLTSPTITVRSILPYGGQSS